MLLAGLLTTTLLLAGLLVRILALLAGILIRIVTHIDVSLVGSRKVTVPVDDWLQRNFCSSAGLLAAPAGHAQELRSAMQLGVDDDARPQPVWLPPLVPAVRKWDDATIRLPEPSTC